MKLKFEVVCKQLKKHYQTKDKKDKTFTETRFYLVEENHLISDIEIMPLFKEFKDKDGNITNTINNSSVLKSVCGDIIVIDE